MTNQILKRLPELPAKNESFMSTDNLVWFYFVLNYIPEQNLPVVFLPCGSANKTRNIDGRKYISKGFSHEIMSVITRNPKYCKIILSEPLSLIPYDLEANPLRKDYNLPPNYLAVQSEFIFINNIALYLARLKLAQPDRQLVYYLGAAHHYFILYFANKLAGSPFRIMHVIPQCGLRDYAKGAKEMVGLIQECEAGKIPCLEIPSLENHLKRRGRYTNLRFWHQILLMQKENASFETVCPRDQYKSGFQMLYNAMLGRVY